MKNFKFIIAALVLLVITSCNKYLDTNTSPNQSTQSRVDLVLTSAQLQLSLAFGGRSAEQLLTWNQYWTGDQSVVTNDWDKNDMKPSDGNAPWNRAYSQSLSSLQYIIKSGKQPKYAGVAKILMAYEYQLLVDLYGDVPFTDALKGSDADPNRSPVPDNQADIYPKLIAMVDEAQTLLDTTGAGIDDVQGDLVFGSDPNNLISNWHVFANALKLKLLMRQANTTNATIATQVADLVSTGGYQGYGFTFTGAEYAGVEFTGDAASKLNANPLWTELQGGALKNYFYGSSTIISLLTDTEDPRIDAQFTPPPSGPNAGNQVGLDQGDQAGIIPGTFFSRPKGGKWDDAVLGDAHMYGPNVPFILISNWEVNLLLAEAAVRGYTSDDAETLYNSAVESNFNYFGVLDPATYEAAGLITDREGGGFDGTTEATGLKSIALQKWVCMDGIQATESWIETRRLDRTTEPIFQSPGGIFLDPPSSVLAPGTFPSILLYSESETNFNANLHQHTTTDKVFWDR